MYTSPWLSYRTLFRLVFLGVFLFLGLLFLTAAAVPGVVERGLVSTVQIMEILEGKAKQIGVIGQTPWRIALMIGLNNIAIILSPLVLLSLYIVLPGILKFVPVGLFLLYAPFLFLTNILLGGLVTGAVAMDRDVPILLLVMGLLPHAVFEFIAISLTAFSAPLLLIWGLGQRGSLAAVVPPLLSRLWLLAPAVIAVLIVAALVEVFISPLLLHYLITG